MFFEHFGVQFRLKCMKESRSEVFDKILLFDPCVHNWKIRALELFLYVLCTVSNVN